MSCHSKSDPLKNVALTKQNFLKNNEVVPAETVPRRLTSRCETSDMPHCSGALLMPARRNALDVSEVLERDMRLSRRSVFNGKLSGSDRCAPRSSTSPRGASRASGSLGDY